MYSPSQIKFSQGLVYYIEDVEHRTLFYLDEMMKIYCLTTLPQTHTTLNRPPPSPDRDRWQVETHPLLEEERTKYHQIQHSALRLRNESSCRKEFANFGIDGSRSEAVAPPICRNNNGSKPIVRHSFCEELMGAQQYVVMGHAREEWVNQTCGAGANQAHLPTCEYDCNHPTLCVRTGK